MFVATVVSSVLGANCYLAAPAPSGPAVIIDPGYGVLPELKQIVDAFGLNIMAVLITHGHPDHILGLREVCEYFKVGAYVASGDRYRLDDPMAGLDSQLSQIVTHLISGYEWCKPENIVSFTVKFGTEIDLAIPGIAISAIAAPGHTEGSTIYLLDGVPASGDLMVHGATVPLEGRRTAFTGDVLFSGSVGRTDLPGGDALVMKNTLRHLSTELDPMTLVLAGHGPHSRMDIELRQNPYLKHSG